MGEQLNISFEHSAVTELEIGQIVTSVVTGARIKIRKIYPTLIVGLDMSHIDKPEISGGFRRGWNGERILSKKNITKA